MPRRTIPQNGTAATKSPAPAQVPEPHVIVPHAVYLLAQAQHFLRLTPSTVRREHREGRLRVAKRSGRYFILGEWLLEWIRGGEVRRKQPVVNGHHTEN